MKPVVAQILGTNRSGSTWVGLVLGSLPGAASLGEVRRLFVGQAPVVCRLCEADGHADCRYLYGIAEGTPPDAYTLAADRLGAQCLIDTSKHPRWTGRLARSDRVDLRLIHLIRHPCGYVASEMRREARPPLHLARRWERENKRIERTVARSDRPALTVCYDDLADDPNRHFPELAAFLGLSWTSDALAYWTAEHHGLGGNGAASAFLRDRQVVNYETGDDAFYHDITNRPLAADRRWKSVLDSKTADAIVNRRYAKAVRERLGGGQWERLTQPQSSPKETDRS